MNIENYFNMLTETAVASPATMYVSLVAALIFIVGGIILYLKRGKIDKLRGLIR